MLHQHLSAEVLRVDAEPRQECAALRILCQRDATEEA
jgi:hypothetical protein